MARNEDLAHVISTLREIATLLTLDGASVFRVRAYENGIRTLETTEEDIALLIAQNALDSLPGIGKSLATNICEL